MDDKNTNAQKMLSDLLKKEEEDLARTLAPKHGIPYLDLSRVTVDLDSLKLVPENVARENQIAVIQAIGKKAQIITTNPDRLGCKEVLEDLTRKKYQIQLFLVSPTSIKKALDRYIEIPKFEATQPGVVDLARAGDDFIENLKSIARIKSAVTILLEEKEGSSKQASGVLETLLAGALAIDVSDVHIEGGEGMARVRFRMDGVLQDIIDLPTTLFNVMLSRLKLVS